MDGATQPGSGSGAGAPASRPSRLQDSDLTAIFLTSPDGMVVTRSGTGEILAANPALGAALERPVGTLIGRLLSDVGFAGDPVDDAQLEHALGTDQVVSGLETRFWTMSGRLRVGRLSIVSVVFHGEPCRFTTLRDVTDHHELRRRMSASVELYKSLIRRLPDTGVIVFDKEQRYLVAEGKLLEDLGWDDPATLRAHMAQRLTPEILELIRSTGQDALAGRERRTETAFAGRTFDIQTAPLADPDGGIVGGMFVARDVTAERKLHSALRDERDFASAVLDTAATLVLVLDRNLHVVRFNRACERLSGWTFEEIRGKDYAELFRIPEDRALFRYRMRTAEPSDFPMNTESLWVTRSGDRRRVEWRATALTNGKGEMDFLVGTGLDVTERRRDEAELRHAAGLRRVILDSANFSIIATDANGVIRSMNATAERWLGWTSAEVVGGMEVDVIHARAELAARASELSRELGQPFAPGFEVLIAKARIHGVEEHEWTYVRKDGTRFPVLLSVTPLYGSDGSIDGFLGIAADITERRDFDRIKNEFVSTVSHELRTPLTSIRGALGLLEGGVVGELSEGAREWIQMARVNADRLVRLINDILDLDKIETGHLQLRSERLEAGELVQAAIAEMRGMAEQAQVRLNARPSAPLYLHADRDRLLQVFTNLLSNAIKYSPAGQPVEIRVERVAEGRMRFSITDFGPGIPAHQLDKLFGKFQQLDASDSRAKSGTGLGLAISRAIVAQHGGQMGVESTPGRGSTFHFDLPAEVAMGPVADGRALSSEVTVLLVEDDANLTRALRQLLEERGYSTHAAGTLVEARLWLVGHTPEVILLDMQLPDGSGLDLVTYLRGDVHGRSVPVIVLSGLPPSASEVSVPTVFEWLQKPVDGRRRQEAQRRALSAGQRKVLVVDADPQSLAATSAQLRTLNLRCVEAADSDAAIALARQEQPDLIVLDLNLPGTDGFDVIEQLRRESDALVPLIVYASRELTEGEKFELTLGATHHITKNATTNAELVRCVRELLETTLARTRAPERAGEAVLPWSGS